MKIWEFLKLLTEVGWNNVEYTLTRKHTDYGEVFTAHNFGEVLNQVSRELMDNYMYAEDYEVSCINFS